MGKGLLAPWRCKQQMDEDFLDGWEKKEGEGWIYTRKIWHSPWKLMIGRLVSFLGLPIFISGVYRFTSSYFDDGKSSVRQSARNSSTHVTESNSCHNCFVNEPQLLEIHCRPPAPPSKKLEALQSFEANFLKEIPWTNAPAVTSLGSTKTYAGMCWPQGGVCVCFFFFLGGGVAARERWAIFWYFWVVKPFSLKVDSFPRGFSPRRREWW